MLLLIVWTVMRRLHALGRPRGATALCNGLNEQFRSVWVRAIEIDRSNSASEPL